jgi:hypothetical protein
LVESTTTQSLGFLRAEYEGDFILSFSSPVKTFGFEARPAIGEFAPLDQLVWADFYKGGPLDPWIEPLPWSEGFGAPLSYVGSIERRVSDAQGALLFAARTTTEYFTQVRVFFREAGHIANLRYSVGEPPAPTHGLFFARSVGRPDVGGPDTLFSGQPDQVTMNVGETLRYAYLVRFRNTGEFLDVTANQNTAIFTDPPMGRYWWGGWQATEETRNKIFPLYARYYEPYTGQSITDTIRVYVRP